MYVFIVVLIIIVSVLLALVVLAQNSKGGGLAANFAAPQQVMGVRQTADFMEKGQPRPAGGSRHHHDRSRGRHGGRVMTLCITQDSERIGFDLSARWLFV